MLTTKETGVRQGSILFGRRSIIAPLGDVSPLPLSIMTQEPASFLPLEWSPEHDHAATLPQRNGQNGYHDHNGEALESAGQLVETERRAHARMNPKLEAIKYKIHGLLMKQIDLTKTSTVSDEDLRRQLVEMILDIVREQKLLINLTEHRVIKKEILDDMLGLGPLEPLLRAESITDILVNGPFQIFVERGGKLEMTDVRFRDEEHVMNVAQRIVSTVGRRVDESNPVCDARLRDGSRVNIIAPPLTVNGGYCLSIRKFSQKKITLQDMAEQGNLSEALGKVLGICGASRLNIIISGGTGSGKTTLLNAISRSINPRERIVTIEDTAELQLQQPHVVALETRNANIEGHGQITMRDLVKNALRMRPDRIILGEVRGGESFDLMQAMNTGHDGSMSTLHANTPRDALMRLEHMISMAGVNLSTLAMRTHISRSVHLVAQVCRMRDGIRRVTQLTEIIGMEGDVIVTQDLFTFECTGEDADGKLTGEFKYSGHPPHFLSQSAHFGLGRALNEAIHGPARYS